MIDDPIFQPTRLGSHLVPGIWRYMLPEDVFYYRVDPEAGSSCFDCPQVKKFAFHASVRCCTYIPRIPNFLLGMSLHAGLSEQLVSAQINAGFALPEGSQVSPLQLQDSLQHLAPQAAKKISIVCPFLDLDSKKCQMYAFRNGVCSTFFCRHDRGERSQIFWENLQDFVCQIESALAQWALEAVGFDLEAYFHRFNSLAGQVQSCSDPQSRAWSLEARQLLFGEWFGQEIELFKRCADAVMAKRETLYELACQQRLRQTLAFDSAARLELLQTYPAHLVQESLPEGEPEAVSSIWYGVQLAYRNLQLTPPTSVMET